MVKAQKQIKTDGSTIITNRNLFMEKPSIKDLKDLINAHIHIEGCRLEETEYRNTYLLTSPQIEEEIYIVIASMNGGGAKANKKFVIPYSSKRFRELLLSHKVEIFGVFPTISDDGNIKFALCRVSDAQIRSSSIYYDMLEGKTNLNSSSRWFNFNDLYNALINNTTIKINGETKIIPFSSLDDFIMEEYCKDKDFCEEFNSIIETGYKNAVVNNRKTTRVNGIHQYIANALKKMLPDNYDVFSATPDSNQEQVIEGFYDPFKADIAISRNGEHIGCVLNKLIVNNYLQNSSNYMKNLRGETVNLKRADIRTYNLFIAPAYIPYFKKDGKFDRIEKFGKAAVKKILSLEIYKGEEFIENPDINCLYLLDLNNLEYLQNNLGKKLKSEEYMEEYLNSIRISQMDHNNLSFIKPEQKEQLNQITDFNSFINEIYEDIKSKFPEDFEEIENLAIA